MIDEAVEMISDLWKDLCREGLGLTYRSTSLNHRQSKIRLSLWFCSSIGPIKKDLLRLFKSFVHLIYGNRSGTL